MKVFISYAKEDRDAATRLYSDLFTKGVDAWIDIEKLLPGQNWEYEINNAIKESNYFIILLSTQSVGKKGFVQNELDMAFDLLGGLSSGEVFVIPVRIDDCTIVDTRISELHCADLFVSYENALTKICEIVLNDHIYKFSKYLAAGNLVLENIDFKFFEGAWSSKIINTTHYARVVNNNLCAIYCFDEKLWQRGVFYDARLIYDRLIFRFKWLDKSYSGVGYLKVDTINILNGGWWLNKDIPGGIAEDISTINDSVPNMRKWIFMREENAIVPFWAEQYFLSCNAQK